MLMLELAVMEVAVMLVAPLMVQELVDLQIQVAVAVVRIMVAVVFTAAAQAAQALLFFVCQQLIIQAQLLARRQYLHQALAPLLNLLVQALIRLRRKEYVAFC